MSFLAFLASFILFLISALAPEFDWNLHGHDLIAWGLTFLALGFLLPGAVTAYRTRNLP